MPTNEDGVVLPPSAVAPSNAPAQPVLSGPVVSKTYTLPPVPSQTPASPACLKQQHFVGLTKGAGFPFCIKPAKQSVPSAPKNLGQNIGNPEQSIGLQAHLSSLV